MEKNKRIDMIWRVLEEVFLKKKTVKLLKPYPRTPAKFLKGGG